MDDWKAEPATDKQMRHIDELSGVVWVGMTKGEASQYIEFLHDFHYDSPEDYTCKRCSIRVHYRDEKCPECSAFLKKGRSPIYPKFKETQSLNLIDITAGEILLSKAQKKDSEPKKQSDFLKSKHIQALTAIPTWKKIYFLMGLLVAVKLLAMF